MWCGKNTCTAAKHKIILSWAYHCVFLAYDKFKERKSVKNLFIVINKSFVMIISNIVTSSPFRRLIEAKYSRMDQVKCVEGSF